MRSGETTGALSWAAAGQTGRSATVAATSMNAIGGRQARKRAPADEIPIPRLLRIAFSSGSSRKSDVTGQGSVICRIAYTLSATPLLLACSVWERSVKPSGRNRKGKALRGRLGRGVSVLTPTLTVQQSGRGIARRFRGNVTLMGTLHASNADWREQ